MTHDGFVIRAIVLASAVLTACGSSEADGAAAPRKAEVPPVPAKPTLESQAESFVMADGSAGADKVDWETAAMAFALIGTRDAAKMIANDEEFAEMFGGDPIERLLAKLRELDHADAAKRFRDQHVSKWKGATACKATRAQEAALAELPEELLPRLPAKLQAATRSIQAGARFEVDCAETTTVLVLDGDGRVLALERMEQKSDSLSLDDLEGENRFVDYMTQQDEVPEEAP